MKNNISSENDKNLLSSLMPKINDYFNKNQFLEKSKLSEFISYINLSNIIGKEIDQEKL